MKRQKLQIEFNNSAQYWEDRYRRGGNSGAGSYNRLAEFKAAFLNSFVEEMTIETVIELGSGDGAQLALARYPKYVGIDVSQTIVNYARQRFAHNSNFSFLHTSQTRAEIQADLALSLDVIYHLVEDEVYDDYMVQLFQAAKRFVIVYASDVDRTWQTPHVRERNFTTWVQKNRPDFVLLRHVPNAYPYDPENPTNTSFSDFFVFKRLAAEAVDTASTLSSLPG